MSESPSHTDPSTVAPGVVSCMRFRERSSVVLPQPEGPISAVIRPAGKLIVTPLSANFAPKRTPRSRTLIAARGSGSEAVIGAVMASSGRSATNGSSLIERISAFAAPGGGPTH